MTVLQVCVRTMEHAKMVLTASRVSAHRNTTVSFVRTRLMVVIQILVRTVPGATLSVMTHRRITVLV